MKQIFFVLFTLLLVSCAHDGKRVSGNSSGASFDAELSGFEYPYPVKFFTTMVQDESVNIAFMDESKTASPVKTVVLFHGKNFSGFYFSKIMNDLLDLNYRVIAIDQIGFGKSTKPKNIQYTFQILAKTSNDVLKSIKASKFTLVGHSMGGMLATRYALMYPSDVVKLILVNPIGLEDYKVLTTYKSIDELYQMELKSSKEKIIDYQKVYYYDGQWNEEYEKLIIPAVGWLNHSDYPQIALNAAKTSELIYTQPVVYEFKHLQMPVTLINGNRDKTAPGKNWAPKANQALMGNYPKLGREVAKMIPKGKLVELKGLGHVPFLEDYATFMKSFLAEFR